MLRSRTNAAFGLVVVAVSAALLHQTTTFEGEAGDRMFPQLILVILVLLGAALILSEIRLTKAAKPAAAGAGVLTARNGLAFVLAIGYPLTAFTLGFFATTFFFLLIVPWCFARSEPLPGGDRKFGHLGANIIYAVVVTAFLYLSFDTFLKFSLPSGLLM